MSYAFVSDLHLAEGDGLFDPFAKFLKQLPNDLQALYILGDFFNVWIGDDDDTPFHRAVIEALRGLRARGIPVFVQHGNRDFLLNKGFASATGCELLPEEAVLVVGKERILLMHGDTLCTNDSGYQRARRYLRAGWVQSLFGWLPLSWRRSIAGRLRQNSMRHTSMLRPESMDVVQDAVLAAMHRHRAVCLVHGHTHQMATHDFYGHERQQLQRIVLPAWHEHAHALFIDQDASKRWVSIY